MSLIRNIPKPRDVMIEVVGSLIIPVRALEYVRLEIDTVIEENNIPYHSNLNQLAIEYCGNVIQALQLYEKYLDVFTADHLMKKERDRLHSWEISGFTHFDSKLELMDNELKTESEDILNYEAATYTGIAQLFQTQGLVDNEWLNTIEQVRHYFSEYQRNPDSFYLPHDFKKKLTVKQRV